MPNLKFEEYAQSLQALYINISWKSESNPEGKTIEDLVKFHRKFKSKNYIRKILICLQN